MLNKRWFWGVLISVALHLGVSQAGAELACEGTKERCEGVADLSKDTFALALAECGALPQVKFALVAGGPPQEILCKHTGTNADGSVAYECKTALLKGRVSGQLKLVEPDCKNNVFPVAKIATAANANAEAPARASEDADRSPPFMPATTWQQVLQELGLPLAGSRPGNYYNRGDDVAVLFLDGDGTSYYPMLDVIDEDDDVYVVVVDYASRLGGIRIGVTGCNRPPSEPRVYGEKPDGGARVKPDEPLQFVVRAIGKCAGSDSGGPQVSITRGEKVAVITIPVNPLYRFALGVALAYDGTDQREFLLNTLPGETVPRIAQVSEPIGLSSLVHVSFYPSARDFRKTQALLWQRTQLFVGLDPRALDKHLVVGVGYELTMGLNALLGWRLITRQQVLGEGSGLRPGMAFDGDARDLPTRERWEVGGVFAGVGLSSSLLSRLR
jgi:hypothetical protein